MDAAAASSPGAPGRKTAGRQPPWERGAETETGNFGAWLRRQRELREISLRDVADRTKISLRYLEAMEDDRFDLLPAPVFAKGFLREYARYIGLSPDEVVNHYLAVHGLDGSERAGEEAEPERHAPRPARPLWLLALLFLLATAAIAVGSWIYLQSRGAEPATPKPGAPAGRTGSAPPPPSSPPLPSRETPPADVAPAAGPVGSESAAGASATPRSSIELTLDFTRDCWVEATVDGKPEVAEQRVAGESLQINAEREVVLKLGNAAAVEAQVNGFPLALPTAEGQVLSDLKVDLETVRSLREKNEAG